MFERQQFKKLRDRAEEILNKGVRKNETLNNQNIYELARDLHLYQIELELQNEDLLKAQCELEESRDKYVDLYELAPVGYFTLNENGLIVEVNNTGADLLGVEKYSLINRSFSRYIAPNYQDIFYHHRLSAFKEMVTKSCEIKLLRRGGSLFYVQLESKALINHKTGNKQLLTFVTDITRRIQSQELMHQLYLKMSHIDRISSMGELTSTITHELTQPLFIIQNYLHGCIQRLQSGHFQIDALLHAIQQAEKQTHRATEIILRMKNFTCKGILAQELSNIDILIQETITLINYEIGEFPITIQYKPGCHLPDVMLDKIHIQQVILNLARNAIEAMRDDHTPQPMLIIETDSPSNEWVTISIVDHGPGFSLDIFHKLFEPHFTTKSYGIGLGLAVSRTIIEAHGGQLLAVLNPTRGASFKFTLPVSIPT